MLKQHNTHKLSLLLVQKALISKLKIYLDFFSSSWHFSIISYDFYSIWCILHPYFINGFMGCCIITFLISFFFLLYCCSSTVACLFNSFLVPQYLVWSSPLWFPELYWACWCTLFGKKKTIKLFAIYFSKFMEMLTIHGLSCIRKTQCININQRSLSKSRFANHWLSCVVFTSKFFTHYIDTDC